MPSCPSIRTGLGSPIDKQIYGHFLEHINHSVEDGLFAEQIQGCGFERERTSKPTGKRPAGRLAGDLPPAVRGGAGDRPPLVPRRLPDPRLPRPPSGALPLDGRRDRSRGPEAPGERGGERDPPPGPAPRRLPAGQPLADRAGREDRFQDPGGEAVLRPDDRRRRPLGAGGGGLWRLRGAAHADGGGRRSRRAGRAPARGSRTTWASPPASPAPTWPAAASPRPSASAPRSSPRRRRRGSAWKIPTASSPSATAARCAATPC